MMKDDLNIIEKVDKTNYEGPQEQVDKCNMCRSSGSKKPGDLSI
jgi:hypothetical protein